ncbi:MAG: hypothetical protein ACI9YE_003338, partial [Psychroserpens sp.]
WLIPISMTIVLGAFVDQLTELGFLMYLLMFSLFYNIGKISFFDQQKLRRNGYLIFGSLGIVIIVLTMSFDGFWYMERFFINTQEMYVSIILFAANLGLLIYSYSKGWLKTFNLFQFVFILFSMVYVFGLNIPIVGTIVVNLTVLALGVMTIKIGTDKFHFGVLNYGLLIITALITCRFFDTNMSFVIRGLLFICIGLGFFLTNYIMLKKQKSRVESLKH